MPQFSRSFASSNNSATSSWLEFNNENNTSANSSPTRSNTSQSHSEFQNKESKIVHHLLHYLYIFIILGHCEPVRSRSRVLQPVNSSPTPHHQSHFTPESIYVQDNSEGILQESTRMIPLQSHFEYQGDFSSQVTEIGGKI